jgi:DNA-binding LacI/PurR family transcriptional regulator
VHDAPPFLTRYAVVSSAPRNSGNRFLETAMLQATRITRARKRRLTVYPDLLSPRRARQYDELVDKIRHHRVAGVLICESHRRFSGTPLVETPELPCMAIDSQPAAQPHVGTILHDIRAMLVQMIQQYHAAGRRRPAILATNEFLLAHGGILRDLLQESELSVPDYLFQSVALKHPDSAGNIVRLMLHPDLAARPDGLIVLDDNLLPVVDAVLGEMGVDVPGACYVISHANFPCLWQPQIAAKLIGFDVRDVFDLAFEVIDAWRRGETPVMNHKVAPYADDEL